jgi:hypothetical protein
MWSSGQEGWLYDTQLFLMMDVNFLLCDVFPWSAEKFCSTPAKIISYES